MKFKPLFSFESFSKWIGLIILPLIVYFGFHISHITFNYDVDSFYDPLDPEVEVYNQFKNDFENENDYILIGVRNEKGVFRNDFLVNIDSLTHLLEKRPWVSKIISPTTLYESAVSFGTPIKVPVIHLHDSIQLLNDKSKIYSGSIYKGLIFSGDEQSVSLIIKIDIDSFPGNESVVKELNNVISSFNFSEFHIAGRPITQFYYKTQMRNEMKLFIILAIILVFISVVFIFKSILISIFVLVSLSCSLIVVYGVMGWFNYQISLIQTMLPLILIITGVSPCIHLVTYYTSQIKEGNNFALKNAFWFTFTPNALNTFTTSLGFSTLYLLQIPPIQEFAIVTSSGVLITFIVSIGMLTTLLSVVPVKPKLFKNYSGKAIVDLYIFSKERKIIVYSFSVFLLFISVYSISKLETKNNFLDDVPASSELKTGLDFFENNFSGIRPIEIVLTPKIKSDTILTSSKLHEINKVQSFLKSNIHAEFIFSPVDIAELTNKSLHGGGKEYSIIPQDSAEASSLIKRINKRKLWNKFIPVYHSATGQVRITGRTPDWGSNFFFSKTQALKKFSESEIKNFNVTITGASHLMDNANRNITTNFIGGMIIMSVIIVLVIAVYMQSIWLAMISIVVNLLPVLTVFTLLYMMNISLKVSSALMFTVVFGIAVDDTIHFLSTFRKFRKNYSVDDALKNTIAISGLSMMFTSIILTIGFSVFTLSSFGSISAFGIVVAFSLLIALLTDLVLLPVMLLGGEKD